MELLINLRDTVMKFSPSSFIVAAALTLGTLAVHAADTKATASAPAASASMAAKPSDAKAANKTMPAKAPEKAAGPAVKKSDSGICHEAGTGPYKQTKKFTAFTTLDECVKSGGRTAK